MALNWLRKSTAVGNVLVYEKVLWSYLLMNIKY